MGAAYWVSFWGAVEPVNRGTGQTTLSDRVFALGWSINLIIGMLKPHPFSLCCFSLLAALLPSPAVMAETSPLEYVPEWRLLEPYQGTLTAEAFRKRLEIFSPNREIYEYLEFEGDETATLFASPEHTKALWQFEFVPPGTPPPTQLKLAPQAEASLRGATFNQPLKGLRICLDPGHIGGDWARTEERHFRYRSYKPVEEGELTLFTSLHLARKLEAAGAEVVFTKNDYEPVTSLRPHDFTADAIQWAVESGRSFSERRYEWMTRWNRDFFFYRVAEIYARGRRVAELDPDFTLCIHYNAAPWGRRGARLFNVKKVVAFVHGGYTPSELANPIQLFALFEKLFKNDTPKEIELATVITDEMARVWNMKPENYHGTGTMFRVNESPYVWSRNVVANRTFPGPVIFLEGPYMNDRDTFYRIQEGDYEGLREVRGKMVPSLFREFADIVATSLIRHYRGSLDSLN